ncbi:hypothetical protein ALQ06_200187 [Pseudomonas syringae pv. berberidis]|nr:hypothetical protein ALQ06_200187 [Pseudomonas syringae pv. berberidis]
MQMWFPSGSQEATSIWIVGRFDVDANKASWINAGHGGSPVITERLSGSVWEDSSILHDLASTESLSPWLLGCSQVL